MNLLRCASDTVSFCKSSGVNLPYMLTPLVPCKMYYITYMLFCKQIINTFRPIFSVFWFQNKAPVLSGALLSRIESESIIYSLTFSHNTSYIPLMFITVCSSTFNNTAISFRIFFMYFSFHFTYDLIIKLCRSAYESLSFASTCHRLRSIQLYIFYFIFLF